MANITDKSNKKSSNLYLFPSLSGKFSGYSIAVSSDIEYFRPTNEDYQVFIIETPTSINEDAVNTLYIYRNDVFFRLANLISNGHPGFFSGYILKKRIKKAFGKTEFDKIFYGDINFIPLFKYLKANQTIVRLHNSYIKMFDNLIRNKLLFKDFRVLYVCYFGSIIEKKIINEKRRNNSLHIKMITNEERDFINNRYFINCSTLPVKIEPCKKNILRKEKITWNKKLVWFGGLSSHKKIGIDVFIEKVYKPIALIHSDIELDLYGKGTNKYNNSNLRIKGFGFVKDFDFNTFHNSLFINPDIIGGGIKLKLFDFYNNNANCLSTKLGVEGFPFARNSKNLIILPIEEWSKFINDLHANIYSLDQKR